MEKLVPLSEIIEEHCKRAIELASGDYNEASRMLEISVTALYRHVPKAKKSIAARTRYNFPCTKCEMFTYHRSGLCASCRHKERKKL